MYGSEQRSSTVGLCASLQCIGICADCMFAWTKNCLLVYVFRTFFPFLSFVFFPSSSSSSYESHLYCVWAQLKCDTDFKPYICVNLLLLFNDHTSHIHTHGTACILLHMCIGVWAAFNGTNCSDFDHSTVLGDVERRYTQPTIIHTYMRHKHHENAHCTNETRYILKSHICQCHAYQMSLETCTCLSGIYECICNCTYDTPFHTHTKNSVSDRSIPFSEFSVCFGFNWVRAKKKPTKEDQSQSNCFFFISTGFYVCMCISFIRWPCS